MKKHHNKKAYTLLEVTIAMFIVGVLISSGGLLFSNISKSQNTQKSQLVTLDRTDKIYKAILDYLAENKRLPCPARLDSKYSDADYGQESRTAGVCDESNAGWTFIGNNDPANYESDSQNLGVGTDMKILYGMIPINVLSLDRKDAEDGYGNKFTYIMIKEFGVKTPNNSATNGFEYFAGSNRLGDVTAPLPVPVDYINIKSQDGTEETLSNKAIMLIVSHGENGFGSYIPDSGAQKSDSNATNDEKNNIYNATYDRVFFTSSDEIKTVGDDRIIFDDYLVFKSKDQLLRDAELEFVRCGLQQGFIDSSYNSNLPGACLNNDITIANNVSYGENTDITDIISPNINCGCTNSNSILRRTCGKYGKWSDIFCNEDYKIHEVDEVKARDNSGLTLNDDGGNGMFIEDGGNVGIGTTNPGYKLEVHGNIHVEGNVTGTVLHFLSDKRYKKNITPILNILPKINQLVAIYYHWEKEKFPEKNFSDKKQIGFIAQEVEKIFPELIHTDKKGYKSLSYSKLTPFLLQAIKELQLQNAKEIENLKKEYDQKIDKLIKRIEKLENAK